MNKLDTFYKRGIIKRVNQELLHYLFSLGFQIDGLLINLKILAASKFFEHALFKRKEQEYYQLFIEFNILLNSILCTYFSDELVLLAGKKYLIEYQPDTGRVLLKPEKTKEN